MMRAIVSLLTAVIQLTAAALGFFLLLLGLNGFSEKQSTPGLILYLAMGIGSVLGLGVASGFAAKHLVERQWLGHFGAAAAAVICCAIVGVVILVAGFIAALVLAEALRGM